jgi:sulfite reductase alpha subunit-like flavoprotein
MYHLFKKGKTLPRVRVAARESTFSLPKNPQTPVIMIASGAGIAPFKGFTDEKEFVNAKGEKSLFGEMSLFFGCRGKNWDYLYKDELIEHEKSKTLNNLFMAFSRDQVTFKTWKIIRIGKESLCSRFDRKE